MLSHLFAARRVTHRPSPWLGALLASALVIADTATASAQPPPPPVDVTIQDDKPVAAEVVMPIDPTQHVQLQSPSNMLVMIRVDNQNLHLGYIQTVFNIDGQVIYAGNPPGRPTQNQPLPPHKDGKPRTGHYSVYEINKLTIRQEVEVVPTRSKAGEKRRLDAAMVRYIIENKDAGTHKVGIRTQMNTFIMNNRGSLFAAPNHPNKILDGVELKGDKVPDYVQIMQRADLKDPGYVAHMTYNFGSGFDRPDRVALTRLLQFAPNQWDILIMPAMGISAMATFWDPKEIKPNSMRKAAFAFGQGIASKPEGDGTLDVRLGGSFEPGKLFTVYAHVLDPAAGQALTLELPQGMQLVEGRERQPVPTVDEDGNTMVLWKARVLNTGRFNLRVRSSTGFTQTKVITITRPGEKTAGP